MKILITGATGLIGKVVCKKALAKGYKINFLTTSKSKINSLDGCKGFYWDPFKGIIDLNAFKEVSYLINLSGDSIANRWTTKHRNKIIESRVLSANILYNSLIDLQINLKGIISASAIGYYPDTYHYYDEYNLCSAENFIQKVVEKWEKASTELETQTQNLTIVRIGLVMSGKGGILSNIVPSIRFCLGSAFGSGNQWQSWIHIDDLAGIFLHIIKNNLTGTINAVAPNPVTQNQLIKSLARHLNRPLILPNIPKLLVKLILGDRSQLVLSSQKISSRKIEASGFNFKFRDLENAIKDLKIK
tara:strand:- start:603 stop:1508 length:906 start_codon:yes stop_codon:yes gene_type:complete